MHVGTTSLKLLLIILLPYANLLNVQLQIKILNNQHIFIGLKLLNLNLQAHTNRKCKSERHQKVINIVEFGQGYIASPQEA